MILFPLLRTETFEQKAFFGELSYDISDQLTATVGVRHFDYEIRWVESFNRLTFCPMIPLMKQGRVIRPSSVYPQ